jgi:hypothetical protein
MISSAKTVAMATDAMQTPVTQATGETILYVWDQPTE